MRKRIWGTLGGVASSLSAIGLWVLIAFLFRAMVGLVGALIGIAFTTTYRKINPQDKSNYPFIFSLLLIAFSVLLAEVLAILVVASLVRQSFASLFLSADDIYLMAGDIIGGAGISYATFFICYCFMRREFVPDTKMAKERKRAPLVLSKLSATILGVVSSLFGVILWFILGCCAFICAYSAVLMSVPFVAVYRKFNPSDKSKYAVNFASVLLLVEIISAAIPIIVLHVLNPLINSLILIIINILLSFVFGYLSLFAYARKIQREEKEKQVAPIIREGEALTDSMKNSSYWNPDNAASSKRGRIYKDDE